MTDTLYENKKDNIYINKKTKYWIYILTDIQWNIINNNIRLNIMYLSAYSKKHINRNDIIIFYIKNRTGHNGFIGIGQTDTCMDKNTENISVYNDNNLNRYIIHLKSIKLHNNILRLRSFENTVFSICNDIKSSSYFAMKYLKGDCIFRDIPNHFGFNLTKNILTHNSEPIQNNHIDALYSENQETPDNSNYNSEIYDTKDYKIINNIPIMLLTCDKLKTDTKTTDSISKKISIIIKHYKYCSECDITNNNTTELHMTLNKIHIKSIKYTTTEYDLCLESYLSMNVYPENKNNMYIKIYDMNNDAYYTGDILIVYTSKIYNL